MWCSACRQDVPGVTSAVDGKPGCPRCGTLLAIDAGTDLTTLAQAERNEHPLATHVPPSEETPDFRPAAPPKAEPLRISSLRWEAANWELNEKLRHVERLTTTSRRYDEAVTGGPSSSHLRRAPRGEVEPPSFAPPPRAPYIAPHYAPTYPSPHSPTGPAGPAPTEPAISPAVVPHEWNAARREPRPGEFVASIVSWIFLGLATTAFTCGGFLVAWSVFADRSELQSMGTTFIMGGVVALAIGALPLVMLKMLRDEECRRYEAAVERTTASTHVRAPHFADVDHDDAPSPANQRRAA